MRLDLAQVVAAARVTLKRPKLGDDPLPSLRDLLGRHAGRLDCGPDHQILCGKAHRFF